MEDIPERLHQVQQILIQSEKQYHREKGSIRLLAVSKFRTTEEIQCAYQAGQRDFAENYVQEAIKKQGNIGQKDIIWHFIGAIQSNKTRMIAEHFDWVHSIDRLKIAEYLNKFRGSTAPPLNICIQVNISNEESKAGICVNQLETFINEVRKLPNLRLRGLMAMPAKTQHPPQQHLAFATMKKLFEESQATLDKIQQDCYDTLSMGTSIDIESAIAEGATLVRIGTAIFGPRNQPSQAK